MKCAKCDYIRRATDTNPEWQCPSCGVAYAKVKAVGARPPTESDTEPAMLIQQERSEKGRFFNAMTAGGVLCLIGGIFLADSQILQPYMALKQGAAEISMPGFKGIFAGLALVAAGMVLLHHQLFSNFDWHDGLDGGKLGLALMVVLALSAGIRWHLYDRADKRGYANSRAIEKSKAAQPVRSVSVPLAGTSPPPPDATPVPAEKRLPIDSIKDVLVSALDGGEASGIMVADSAAGLGSKFAAHKPIKVDVRRQQALSQSECGRLRVALRQGGEVETFPNGRSAMSAIIWQSIYSLNYCSGGRSPIEGVDLQVEK